MSNEELWQTALAEIELNTSKANFITWFRSTSIVSQKENGVIIGAPNGFSKEWLENKFNKLILKTLRDISPDIRDLSFTIENKKQSALRNKRQQKKTIPYIPDEQLIFEEFTVDKETNLNPKYSFDGFIVGSSNELAYATALAVSQKPGKEYNPLFIYGGVGLGKTHLLQSIGNEVKNRKKSKKVTYISCENFTNEFIHAIQERKTKEFREKYRQVDVLIIDDIQFLANKERTQEEFFHTFNALHENDKQIILSSDRPPKSLDSIDERLRSRFEGGMMADIGYPDFEMRVAILKSKMKNRQIDFSNEVTEYIAQNIQNNIRELEGALNILITSSKVNGTTINLENAKKCLTHIIKRPRKVVALKKMLKSVADFYDISEKDILSQNRKREISHPRQVLMYLMREEMKYSYPLIGSKLGGKDHTTVIHAYTKIVEHLKNNDESLIEEINLLKQEMYSA